MMIIDGTEVLLFLMEREVTISSMAITDTPFHIPKPFNCLQNIEFIRRRIITRYSGQSAISILSVSDTNTS